MFYSTGRRLGGIVSKQIFALDDLSGDVWAIVRNSRHAVGDDGLAFWNGEEELVVHADVDAQHDAVGHLESQKRVFFDAVKMQNRKSSVTIQLDIFTRS
jgi:hypothetical protein